jgi:hypothetical protein
VGKVCKLSIYPIAEVSVHSMPIYPYLECSSSVSTLYPNFSFHRYTHHQTQARTRKLYHRQRKSRLQAMCHIENPPYVQRVARYIRGTRAKPVVSRIVPGWMLNAETPDLGMSEDEALKYLQEMPGRSARRRWSQLIPNRGEVVRP